MLDEWDDPPEFWPAHRPPPCEQDVERSKDYIPRLRARRELALRRDAARLIALGGGIDTIIDQLLGGPTP